MPVRAVVDITSNMAAIGDELTAGLTRGVNRAAEYLLGKTAERAPLRDGTLIASGQVEPASDPDEGAGVSYDTPYAARLHEHPEYNFQNGRQGKYVEEPAIEHKDEIGAIIAAEVSGG